MQKEIQAMDTIQSYSISSDKSPAAQLIRLAVMPYAMRRMRLCSRSQKA